MYGFDSICPEEGRVAGCVVNTATNLLFLEMTGNFLTS